ncbi:MFS transporter [Nocardioides insulae]|uniref:MFS transporter n=1 Tax=Nocardioides insulae TaxID=394734 RepID=UPI000A0737BD|nr:MFS transporter [Nocardioides insulae]
MAHAVAASSEEGSLQQTRRASSASFLGSMLEYYDFNIYASASALIFSEVFFPDAAAGTGLLLAMATFGVAYVARPLGGVVLGHFGDRIGRKNIMLLTLVLMGSSTFLIGCLPDYQAIGWVAPALLVLFRVLQGFSAGGEQSGANALILEHAPTKRRNFFTSWTMAGTTAGIVLASGTFLIVASLPDETLFSWGWRVPFWASAIVVVIAYVIRRKLEEPEVFEEAKDEATELPLVDLFRTHSRAVLRVVVCAMTASIGTIVSVFALAYAVDDIGISRQTMLWVSISSNVLAVCVMPPLAALSDRIGRKPVYLSGVVGCLVFTFAYFQAISTSQLVLIFLANFALTSLSYSAAIVVGTAFYPEMFHTRIRYSGSAIGTQVGYAVAGFMPTIGYAIIGSGRTGWIPIAVLAAVICALAFIAAATARETAGVPIQELGNAPTPPRETDGAPRIAPAATSNITAENHV